MYSQKINRGGTKFARSARKYILHPESGDGTHYTRYITISKSSISIKARSFSLGACSLPAIADCPGARQRIRTNDVHATVFTNVTHSNLLCAVHLFGLFDPLRKVSCDSWGTVEVISLVDGMCRKAVPVIYYSLLNYLNLKAC